VFYILKNENKSGVSKAAKKVAHFTRVASEDFLVFSCGGFSHLVRMRKSPVLPEGVQWGGGDVGYEKGGRDGALGKY
jgi:hypothetical protein